MYSNEDRIRILKTKKEIRSIHSLIYSPSRIQKMKVRIKLKESKRNQGNSTQNSPQSNPDSQKSQIQFSLFHNLPSGDPRNQKAQIKRNRAPSIPRFPNGRQAPGLQTRDKRAFFRFQERTERRNRAEKQENLQEALNPRVLILKKPEGKLVPSRTGNREPRVIFPLVSNKLRSLSDQLHSLKSFTDKLESHFNSRFESISLEFHDKLSISFQFPFN